jgi:hypothetical protein
MATATYDKIATTTLGSAASSITFSSIAASYTDLKLTLVLKCAVLTNVRIQLNSDTGTNYSITCVGGNGATALTSSTIGQSSMRFDINNTTSGSINLFNLDIFSYAGSTYKTVLGNYNADNNGSGFVTDTVGLWRSTAAITSVFVYGQASAFDTGTTATLYGIRAA